MEDGKPYRPSNGTEGMGFVACFCENCIHEKFIHTQIHGDKQCDILDRSFAYGIDDDEYPEEWIYKNGKPTCTNYQHWDWGGDGWSDGLNDPPPKEPNNPNQLMFPFMIDDIIKTEKIEELV